MDICGDMLTCILAAQRRDTGNEWFQFLPIIIIAGLWVLGIILKAVRKQSEQGDEKAGEAEEEPVELNLSRLVELARRRYTGAGRPAEQEPKRGQGPAAVPPMIPKQRESRPVRGVPAGQRPVSRAAAAGPAVRHTGQRGKETGQKGIGTGGEIALTQPDIAPLPEFSEPTFEGLTAMHEVQTGRQRLTGILEDFSGRDSLKRAILHYEILGKCITMRESQSFVPWS